jgi:uncharacterized protein with HEPN domain
MPRHDDGIRLQHMLDAAREAVAFTEGRARADLDTDRMLQLSLVKLLEVVGEAARGVSQECRSRLPQIPWQQIVGTRDRLVHGYFDVDWDIVWTIATGDLPPLITELERIVPPT